MIIKLVLKIKWKLKFIRIINVIKILKIMDVINKERLINKIMEIIHVRVFIDRGKLIRRLRKCLLLILRWNNICRICIKLKFKIIWIVFLGKRLKNKNNNKNSIRWICSLLTNKLKTNKWMKNNNKNSLNIKHRNIIKFMISI
jgi:hypothetical protein